MTLSARRLIRAVVLSTFTCIVLLTHVFVGLDRIRVRVVRTPIPASNGSVRVTAGGSSRVQDLRSPLALIATIDGAASGAARFSIDVDGVTVCEPLLTARPRQRVDCAVTSWQPAAGHEITIRGPSAAWTVTYLELATHHGNTSGALELVVLPSGSRQFTRIAPAWAVLLWLLLTAGLLLPEPARLPRGLRPLSRVAGALVVAIWTLALLSEWLSAYLLVISFGTFVRSLVLLFICPVWVAGRWLLRPARALPGRWTALARCAVVGLLVAGAYGAVVANRLRDTYDGNYSGFLALSERTFERNPLLNTRDEVRRTLVLKDGGGYDGQFMYFAAFDPLLRAFHDRPEMYRDVMDGPPYRFGRIGFSWLANLFSAGQWQLYPATMMWLIMGSLFVGGLCVALIASANGESPALGGLLILVPGFWQSLQTGLPEPVAAALLIGGYLCLSRAWWTGAGLLFAMSLLVRETGIVAVGCLVAATLASGRRREALSVALISLAPVLLWRLYVAWVLYPGWGMEALFPHPPDLGWPLAGVRDLWTAVAGGRYYPGFPELSRAAIFYPLLLVVALALAAVLAVRAPNPLNLAAVLYGILAISLNFKFIWVHVGNGQRGTYELFVMLALCSLGISTYPPWLRKSLWVFWGAAAAYVFVAALDAWYIRSCLLMPL